MNVTIAVALLVVAVAAPLARRLPAGRSPLMRARRWTTLGDRWLPRRRSRPPADDDVAAWCEQVASALRGGSSLTQAIVATDRGWTGPPVMPTVAHALRRGRNLATALEEVPTDPSSASGLADAVLRSCAQLGGPAASAVERLADTLRARATERAERRTAGAQARLSAQVLTVLPFAVLALLTTTDDAVRAAIATPAGLACVAIGAVLNVLGWCWMRRLIGASA